MACLGRSLLILVFTAPWPNIADDILIFFFYFVQKIGINISCKLSLEENFVEAGNNTSVNFKSSIRPILLSRFCLFLLDFILLV